MGKMHFGCNGKIDGSRKLHLWDLDGIRPKISTSCSFLYVFQWEKLETLAVRLILVVEEKFKNLRVRLVELLDFVSD